MLNKIVALLSTEFMTKLLLVLATELAKKTDNKFDDKLVELFKEESTPSKVLKEVKKPKDVVANVKTKNKKA